MLAIVRSLAGLVNQFLSKFFTKLRTPVTTISAEVAEKKERAPRKYNKDKTKTFADLLDNLEYTFDSVKLPTMRESWLDKDTVVGLKKLGIHVPNPWVAGWSNKDVSVDVNKPLPALMCISSATADTVNTKDLFYPKILFAVKLKKLPWHVTRKPGTPYQFGMAFDAEGKLFWSYMYMTVNDSTGEISFCDEFRVKTHRIGRGKIFYTKGWSSASYLEDCDRSVEDNKRITKNYFVSMHDWWSERDSRWNVIVKKNGDRVTFGVDNSQTPYYFKDRDKSIKTASGQTKKIVHYVKEHERKVNDKTTIVKEHVRGLQEFNWATYNCKVVSPKLQARTSALFTAPSVYEDPSKNSNFIYMSKVGKVLADAEECNV